MIRTAGIFELNRPPSDDVISFLAHNAEYSELLGGERLYTEGDFLDAVYCLLSGSIDVSSGTTTVKDDGGSSSGCHLAAGNMEVASKVQVEGLLVGKMVEAYVGEHEAREKKLDSVKQAARESAEVCDNHNKLINDVLHCAVPCSCLNAFHLMMRTLVTRKSLTLKLSGSVKSKDLQ